MSLKSILSYFNIKKKHEPKKEQLPLFFERQIEDVYSRQFKNTNLKFNEIFNFGADFVFYFDTEKTSDSDEYIVENYLSIKEQFNSKGRTFFHIPFLIKNSNDFIVPLLKECFPDFSDLSYLAINEELKKSVYDESSFMFDFFQFINYEGNIKRGFLSSNQGFTIVEHKENESIDQFINDYIKYLPKTQNTGHVFYSIDKKLSNTLQKESIESYNIIKTNLEKLRDNGELLIIAPKLYKLLENNLQGIIFEEVAPITITKDFRVLISNHENHEIKLSHLTKTVFIFFLIQTEAVDIKNMKNYEKQLLSIYTNVSNQLSLDKLKDSIQELINPDSDAIYIHFSRIKAEMLNHFDSTTAYQYTINGDKGKPKKILLPKNKISFEQPIL